MLLSEVTGTIRRRWALILVGLLMTSGLVYASTIVVKPTYEATASLLLLPPASSLDTETNPNTNPYLGLDGLRLTVDLLGVAMSDQQSTSAMQELSPTVEFTTAADPRNSGPILLIEVWDHSPRSALAIRDAILENTPPRLAALQEEVGVTEVDQVTSTVLASDSEAEPVGSDQLRAIVIALALGLGLTALAVAAIDGALLRRAATGRRSRRSLRTSGTPAADPIPTPEDAIVPEPPGNAEQTGERVDA